MTKKSVDLKIDALDGGVLGVIEAAVTGIVFGSITLVVQDSCLLQMEKVEKVRFADLGAKPAPRSEAAVTVRAKITTALKGLRYGQVVLVVKDGKITQIEKTEKQRFTLLEGVNGEGI